MEIKSNSVMIKRALKEPRLIKNLRRGRRAHPAAGGPALSACGSGDRLGAGGHRGGSMSTRGPRGPPRSPRGTPPRTAGTPPGEAPLHTRSPGPPCLVDERGREGGRVGRRQRQGGGEGERGEKGVRFHRCPFTLNTVHELVIVRLFSLKDLKG